MVRLSNLSARRLGGAGSRGDTSVAAVDIGTNTTRLLVASASGGGDIVRDARITRLGQGVDRSGILAPEAVERTLDVLCEYRELMSAHGAGRVRAVATSAVRDATNGRVFIESAGRALGTEPEILEGIEEGRLAFAGATRGIGGPEPSGAELVIDIGGGSTELIRGFPGDEQGIRVVSLDIGSVRITERLLCHDPPSSAEIAEARAEVRHLLDSARQVLASAGDVAGDVTGEPAGNVAGAPAGEVAPWAASGRPGARLIGVAGTVTTVAALEMGLDVYDRDVVHHSVLSRADITHWVGVLSAEPSVARLARPGMVPGREDVIVAGTIILEEAMAAFGRDALLVSDSDILDGMVCALLASQGAAPAECRGR